MNPSKVMPDSASSDQEWISWHQEMKKRYGKKDANLLFSERWNNRKPRNANTGNLRDYMRDQGVVIDSGSLLGSIRDEGAGIVDSIGNVLKIGGYVGIAVIAVPVLIVGVVLFQALKNPAATAGAIKTARGF